MGFGPTSVSRYDVSREDLAVLLGDEPSYRVNQVWDGFYRRLVAPGQLTDLPRALRERLERAPELAMGLRCVGRECRRQRLHFEVAL